MHAPQLILVHAYLGPPSPQPKRHLDRFSHVCTDHSRVSSSMPAGMSFSPKFAPRPRANPNPHPKRYLDRFSRFCRATEHGRFNRIRRVAPMCTTCKRCFLGTSRFQNPNGISIGSAISVQLTAECRYTQHSTPFSRKN